MGGELGEVGQLHVVAEDVAQMGIGIVGHRQVVALEDVCGEGEDLIGVARVVEGDAHGAGDHRDGSA